mgnify:CR=1 FL=1
MGLLRYDAGAVILFHRLQFYRNGGSAEVGFAGEANRGVVWCIAFINRRSHFSLHQNGLYCTQLCVQKVLLGLVGHSGHGLAALGFHLIGQLVWSVVCLCAGTARVGEYVDSGKGDFFCKGEFS